MLPILNWDQNPEHSHIPNTRVLQLKKLKFYSTVCGLEPLTSMSLKKNVHHVRQNSINAEYPNLHYIENIPFMNTWCALQRTMPEECSFTRLTQLNGAITDCHTSTYPCIHEWKSHNNQWAQFNTYLVLKLHLQIKFKDWHRSNKILNS